MEILDIVNDNNKIIGHASKEEVYQHKLPHRIVHIFIFNKKNEMALQLRSDQMFFCPQHWSTPAAGHVRSGEDYDEAAIRETKEEIGIEPKMQFLRDDLYEVDGLKKFLCTFKIFYDGSFFINPDEVEKIEYFSLKKIQEMIDAGEKFHPELLFLLREHFGIK